MCRRWASSIPSEFQPINSIEVVIWVAVGGRGTLYGAVAGAVLVNYAKTFFTAALPEFWLYALGPLFVLVTLFLPRGVVGLLQRSGRSVVMQRAAASGDCMNAAQGRQQGGERRAGSRQRAPQAAASGTILYLEDITVSFDGFRALNDLTLYIDAGELRCIIGPNGAGKTTMMDVITGKTRPDHGSAWFGQHIDLLTLTEPRNRGGRHLAANFRSRRFSSSTASSRTSSSRSPGTNRSGTRWSHGSARRTALHIDEVLDTIGLKDQQRAHAGMLSHGQKQWLEIGMLLMQDPALLLVDEPVAGMTPQEAERTAELLLSLAGKHSVVVVEHDMEFVRSIARTVTVLHEGHVLAEGHMDEVQNDPKVTEVYLGGRSLLTVAEPQPVLQRQPHPVGCGPRGRGGFLHLPHGPQRHGQDHAAEVHHGAAADAVGRGDVRGARSAPACGRGARAARHRLRAAGPRDFFAAHGRGESAGRSRHPARVGRAPFRSTSSTCSRC